MKYVSTEIMMFCASILKHFVCSCHQDFKRLFWHWRQGVLEVYCEMTPRCLLMFCIIWKKKRTSAPKWRLFLPMSRPLHTSHHKRQITSEQKTLRWISQLDGETPTSAIFGEFMLIYAQIYAGKTGSALLFVWTCKHLWCGASQLRQASYG